VAIVYNPQTLERVWNEVRIGGVLVRPSLPGPPPDIQSVPDGLGGYYTDRVWVGTAGATGVIVFAAQGVTGPTGPQGPTPEVLPVPDGSGGFYTDRIYVGGVLVYAAQGATGPTGFGAAGGTGQQGSTGPRVLWPMLIFGA
jgi:hypothetical protein